MTRDNGKINLCLQFWEGDRDRATHLARFLADLETEKNTEVEFTFVARFDTKHDEDTIRYVEKKFNRVWRITGRRHSTGWPTGCNDLALDLFQQSACRYNAGEWKHIKALYLIEPDVMPLCRDWLARISEEWDRGAELGKYILGAWCPWHGKEFGHCNGNMLVAPNITLRIPGLETCPSKSGWDAYLAPKFAPHWTKSLLLQNHYDHRSNIPPEILWSSVNGVTEPAVVHGVKDFSAEQQVREKLGL